MKDQSPGAILAAKVSARIREFCIARGIAADALVHAANLSPTEIQLLEAESEHMTRDMLERIAAVFARLGTTKSLPRPPCVNCSRRHSAAALCPPACRCARLARVISFGLDATTGAVTLSRGTSVSASTTADEAVNAFGEDSDGLLLEGDRYLIEVKGVFAGRIFDVVTFRFDTEGKLARVSFGDSAAIWMKRLRNGDSGLPLLRTRECRDLLRRRLGPPRHENVQRSLHAYPWGFVYASEFGIEIVYPGHCATCKRYLRRTQNRRAKVAR